MTDYSLPGLARNRAEMEMSGRELERALATARAEFSAFEANAENGRIGVLEAERVRIDRAINAADQRTRELSAEISTIIRANPGEAIADALLDNASPSDAATAAPGRDAMIEERARLNGGIAELKRRDGEAYNEIRRVQSAAFDSVGRAAAPLIEALHSEAMVAANRVALCYAALDAVSGVTRSGSTVRDRVGLAVARMANPDCLLPYDAITVDRAIVDVLHALDGKGKALPVNVREFATVPSDLASAALIAGVMGMAKAA